jgi:hypothetical protein
LDLTLDALTAARAATGTSATGANAAWQLTAAAKRRPPEAATWKAARGWGEAAGKSAAGKSAAAQPARRTSVRRAPGEVVMDLACRDELREASERDCRVAAAEAADRHHRPAGREFE